MYTIFFIEVNSDENKKVLYTEKDLIDKVQTIKANIEDYKQQAERAEREGDFGLVAVISLIRIGQSQQITIGGAANSCSLLM